MKKMLTRLAASFSTRPASWNGNITAVWDRCHRHLQPLESRLALPDGAFTTCPLCSKETALRMRAHIRFGPDHWREDASVLHCGACRQYSLTQDEYTAHVAQATLWAQEHGRSDALAAYGEVTAVNARLWARAPTVLNIEPTTRCNFNCWYCIGRHMKQDDIDFDGFVAALNNFPTLKILALVGEGEPLMHKQFFDMVKLAKDRGIRVVTLSNGSAFSESVVKKLCESEVDYISISIDSTDAATFADSRIDGDLNRVLDGIKKLTAYRDANGYKYPLIGVKGSLFDHTRNEMPAIVQAAKQCGVDMFESFQPLNPKRSYVKIYPADKVHLLQQNQVVAQKITADYASLPLPSIVDFAQSENMAISNCGPGNGLRPNCNEEWIYSLLSGDVTPCCQIKDPMDDDWNIFKHSMDEILNNQHYENVRFNLWNGIFLPACDGCSKIQ
jgi:MoaA/NifB/PqqE/SkfB family radical SAM enzyme